MHLRTWGALAAALITTNAFAGTAAQPLHDTDVSVDRVLIVGTRATALIRVTAATGLRESAAVPGASTSVSLEKKGRRVKHLAAGATLADGSAVAKFKVPALELGEYDLVVSTRSRHGFSEVRKPVVLSEAVHLHLRTDRGVYRAGQTVRWRVTGINSADAHPLRGKIEVAVLNPRGTAIWRGTPATAKTGMVAGEVTLGDRVRFGRYRIVATMGDHTSTETFKVEDFRVAPFRLTIVRPATAPHEPGTPLEGHVVARYAHGEPVRGTVTLRVRSGRREIFRKTGRLDKFGRMAFRPLIPDGAGDVLVRAHVTDGAKRKQSARLNVPSRSDALQMTLVPSGKFVIGRKQWVTAITTDGEGNFAPARVFLKVPGRRKRLEKKSLGAVRFAVTPTRDRHRLVGGALDDERRTASETIDIRAGTSGLPTVSVANHNAIIRAGSAIELTGHWPVLKGPVIATLLRRGNPSTSVVATINGKGRLSAALRAPPGLFGLATVRVTELAWDVLTGEISTRSAQTPVYLVSESLSISVDGAKRVRPGQVATLHVNVKDSAGRPAAGVGLAASVIDERVLALSKARPDLVRVLKTLDVGHARAAGIAFSDLLQLPTTKERRLVLGAILASLPVSSARPAITVAAADRFVAESKRISRARSAVYKHLMTQARPLGIRVQSGWEFADALPALLAKTKLEHRLNPWKQPTRWSYARELDPEWSFRRVAKRLANERMQLLVFEVSRMTPRKRKRLFPDGGGNRAATLVRTKNLPAHLAIDPWGTEARLRRVRKDDKSDNIELAYAGPDQVFATADDIFRALATNGAIIGGTSGGYGYGAGGGGGGMRGRRGKPPQVRIGNASGRGAEIATRKRFDETVLWQVSVITDKNGIATLRVPLADSITGWEVAVEALGRTGAVGATKTRIETTLPLYVDVLVPENLTQGDRFELTPVIANHTRGSRRFRLRARVTGALEIAGSSAHEVSLPAGTTRAIRLPVRATRSGPAKVTLTMFEGARAVDSIERSVTVRPVGALERRIASAVLGTSQPGMSIELPAGVAPGSLRSRLTLLRGAADGALDGLEGLLREPHGCFEQASSTTYPNLLVLRLLKGMPGTAAARRRARRLVGKGYQRLISFEVNGGGFSWFGQSPANQVLTAYGLMEFSDMSKVYPVDSRLIKRTREWLLGQQKRDGSWAPDKSWLHDWKANQGKVATTAYVAWALAESGYRGAPLHRALRFLRRNRGALAKRPYSLALWAATEARAKTRNRFALNALLQSAQVDPHGLRVGAGKQTLFYARGKGADVQVTALAASALWHAGKQAAAKSALKWVKGNTQHAWGSTQGTVLALRSAALVGGKPRTQGTVSVSVDGRKAGSVDLASPQVPSVQLSSTLGPGSHSVGVRGSDVDGLSAILRWSWRGIAAPRAVDNGIAVRLEGAKKIVSVGEEKVIKVTVQNTSGGDIAMPTIVVPVPAGFRATRRSLKMLVTHKVVDLFESQGSQVQFYVERLAKGQSLTLRFSLEAEAACDVAQRPAVAYAYYSPQVRGSSDSQRHRTSPRRGAGNPLTAALAE